MEDTSVDKITEKIIASAFKVSNTLGIGFVEKVYENAYLINFGKSRLQVRRLHPSPAWKTGKA